MPPVTSRLYDLAAATLTAVGTHWPGDAEPLPDEQFVTNGLVIWEIDDCAERLCTFVERTFGVEADVALEQITTLGAGFANRGATVGVTLLRCVPDLDDNTVPTGVELDASAQIILGDAQALMNALIAAWKAGDLPGCGQLAFESWTAEGPQGGMGGGTLRMRMLVN